MLDGIELDMGTNAYEDLATWYFRLNGCLTIPNFVLHPEIGNNQCTDADVLAVRFPHRKEVAGRTLQDDKAFTAQGHLIQTFIVEVKKGKCALNGPYSQAKILYRLIQSIGVAPEAFSNKIADSLLKMGAFADNCLAVRIVCVGNETVGQGTLPADALQLTHDEMLTFIYYRFRGNSKAKRSHPQWDHLGQHLYEFARRCRLADEFLERSFKYLNGKN